MAAELSKTQVNACGVQMAEAFKAGRDVLTDEEFAAERLTIDAWRQRHAQPLAWVTTYFAKQLEPVQGQAVLAQRLKRMPQIIKKQARFEKMKLARMQDIGGCRAVLDGPQEVEDAAHRVKRYSNVLRWKFRHEADYREDGKPDTAYRALHLIVVREGHLIEMQLRTRRQHVWAEAVERVTALSDHGVKEGDAPADILRYFRLASDGFWQLDRGKGLTQRHRAACRRLYPLVARYLELNNVAA